MLFIIKRDHPLIVLPLHHVRAENATSHRGQPRSSRRVHRLELSRESSTFVFFRALAVFLASSEVLVLFAHPSSLAL